MIHTIKLTGLNKNNTNGVGENNAMTRFCAHRPMYTSKRLLRVWSLRAKSSRVSSPSREYQPGLDLDFDLEDLREEDVDGDVGENEGDMEGRIDISEKDLVKEKRGLKVIFAVSNPEPDVFCRTRAGYSVCDLCGGDGLVFGVGSCCCCCCRCLAEEGKCVILINSLFGSGGKDRI